MLMKGDNKALYEKIMSNISKQVKDILNEEIQKFNPAEYNNDEQSIIDQHTINNAIMIKPKNRKELEKIIFKRLKENITEPFLLDIDVSDIKDFSYLFSNEENDGSYTYLKNLNPEKIEKLDLSTWNTQNAIDMYGMFFGCQSLTEIDLSGFNTSNITNMSYMFSFCESLKNLDLSNFNTANVTCMRHMFSHCKSLKKLDLRSFNTINVKDMRCMFNNCELLEDLDLSSFDTSNVQSMHSMFEGCKSLKYLDLFNFKTTQLVSVDYMFKECESLKTLDISNMVIRSVGTFNQCFSLEDIKISKQLIQFNLGLYNNLKNVDIT